MSVSRLYTPEIASMFVRTIYIHISLVDISRLSLVD